MTDLSGRVTTLENVYTQMLQDLLNKVGVDTYSNQLIIWNQQYDQFESTLNDISTKVSVLIGLVSNLHIQQAANFALFTGHTGNASMHS
jgi:hypothetical protein